MTSHRNDILIGKIADYGTSFEDGADIPPRMAGYGEVIATLEGRVGFILVRVTMPNEPVEMLVLSLNEPGLRFFDTPADHDAWRASRPFGMYDPDAEARDRERRGRIKARNPLDDPAY